MAAHGRGCLRRYVQARTCPADRPHWKHQTSVPTLRGVDDHQKETIMAAVLTRNPTTDTPVDPPRHEDGTGFRYEMIFETDRSRAYADTPADLLDVLVPGYTALTEEERLVARIGYATNLLAPLQAAVLGAVDQSLLSDEDKAVLLHRATRLSWSRNGPVRCRWSSWMRTTPHTATSRCPGRCSVTSPTRATSSGCVPPTSWTSSCPSTTRPSP